MCQSVVCVCVCVHPIQCMYLRMYINMFEYVNTGRT